MLIAEELLLLALDPDKGTTVNSSRQPLTTTLTGALVAELALEHRVVMDGKRFSTVGSPPSDPLLAKIHAQLGTVKGRRAADQLRHLDKAVGRVWDQVVDGLVARHVVARDEHRVLFFAVTRHPVRRTDLRNEIVRRVQGAATGSGKLEPRTAVLLALSGPSRLLEVVAPDRTDRGTARKRIATATENTPVAPVVLQVLQESQAAVIAVTAATAATTASVAAGSS